MLAERLEEWALGYKAEGKAEGIQQGMKKGVQQGKAEGVQQGMQRGEALALQKLLSKRFGAMPSEVLTKIAGASPAQVDVWLDQVLEAKRLEDLFGPIPH